MKQKSLKYQKVIEKYGEGILNHEEFQKQKTFMQHGKQTTYDHVLAVANRSIGIARHLPFKIDEAALVRAALLHDYYLYDWHHPGKGHRLHLFRHGRWAQENAVRDFKLSKKEQNSIRWHMFPLCIVPPRHLEGWYISTADKLCAVKEFIVRKKKN
jgi:uncharacterized protein